MDPVPGSRQDDAHETSDRLDNIDALRALAVMAVVLFHYTARFPTHYMGFSQPIWPAVYGHFGVQLFFVISGYCIYMTAARCPSLASFWIRRISRLWPAYVAAIAVTFAVVKFWGLPEREVGLLHALANMIWLNGFDGVQYVDGVYWSLIVELKLYVLFGILFFAIKGRGDPILAWSLLCLAGGVIWKSGQLASGGALFGSTSSVVTFAFPYSGYFLAGMLIYRWETTGPWIRVLAGATFVAAALCEAANWTETMILLAMLPLAMLIVRWRTLRVPRPLVFLGYVSYPLYLIHQNVGVVVIRETAHLVPSDYGRILLAILVSVALAAILSVCIEHRFRSQVEQLIGNAIDGAGRLVSRLRLTSATETPRATPTPQSGEL